MPMRSISPDFEVFLRGASEPVGGVREIHTDHLIVWIENRGDTRIDAEHVVDAHDGKVILDPTGMSDELRDAVGHAHDSEAATEAEGVSREGDGDDYGSKFARPEND